jgi:hypothetical protein
MKCFMCGHGKITSACGICGKYTCNQCLYACIKCGEKACLDCGTQCEDGGCREYICNQCGGECDLYFECAICHGILCNMEAIDWFNDSICYNCAKNPPKKFSKSCLKLGHKTVVAGYCPSCDVIYYSDGREKREAKQAATLDSYLSQFIKTIK